MASAYNAIRTQIHQVLEDRTRMLAAVSHDLRTPSTRIRLRAEFITDDALRQDTLRDLDEMDRLLGEVLDFLHDRSQAEEQKDILFPSLIEAICDDYTDFGRPVTFHGLRPLTFQQVPTLFSAQSEQKTFHDHRKIRFLCRPQNLRRAFDNLIENALKYGGSADVWIDANADEISVTIADKGPSIPKDEFENVFLPFYRLDSSRRRSSGGSGLGLAIVKTIIEAHHGSIVLQHGNEHGLIVTVKLPRN